MTYSISPGMTRPVELAERQTHGGHMIEQSRNPIEAFQMAINMKFSGQLIVTDPKDHSVSWRICVGAGKIHFAESLMGQRERVFYLLSRCNSQLEMPEYSESAPGYDSICAYWQEGKLELKEVRNLLFLLMLEALSQVFAFSEAKVQFKEGVGIEPILLMISLEDVLFASKLKVQEWQVLRQEISSGFQRPFVTDASEFTRILMLQVENEPWVRNLRELLERNLTFYEVAKILKMDVFKLALLLHPLVKIGVVGVKSYRAKATPSQIQSRTYKVVCVDDSPTILSEISRFLNSSGYQFSVNAITEPVKALVTIIRFKPDVILLDVGMPGTNGYELCRMIRNHPLFKVTPIIMVTGNKGLIDRAKAKISGATDYLTKPFTQAGLVSVITNNLNLHLSEE